MRRWALVGVLLMSASTVMSGQPAARAADGRVDFSGAVVVATCVPRLSAAAGGGAIQPLRCDDPHRAAAGRISSRRLDAGGAAGNPLLRYYLGSRAPAPGATAPALRVVTIEYQ